jgi:hypothetical protein
MLTIGSQKTCSVHTPHWSASWKHHVAYRMWGWNLPSLCISVKFKAEMNQSEMLVDWTVHQWRNVVWRKSFDRPEIRRWSWLPKFWLWTVCKQARKHRLNSLQTMFVDIVCRCVLAVTFDVISHTISIYDEYKSKKLWNIILYALYTPFRLQITSSVPRNIIIFQNVSRT